MSTLRPQRPPSRAGRPNASRAHTCLRQRALGFGDHVRLSQRQPHRQVAGLAVQQLRLADACDREK